MTLEASGQLWLKGTGEADTRSIQFEVQGNRTGNASLLTLGNAADPSVGTAPYSMSDFYGHTQAYAFDDADAEAFSDAAGLTDNTHKEAIDDLVAQLKTDSIWTKFHAIYPMLGGTATTHKYNLIDPQDTDGAFRITWNGGWTHSSNGALPNGSTGYADTHFAPNSHFDETTYQGWGYYSRTSTGDSDEYVMGSTHSGARSHTLIARRTNDTGYTHADTTTGSYRLTNGTVTNGAAFFHSSQDGTNLVLRRNTTTVATNTTSGSNTPGTYNIALGAINNQGTVGNWSNKQCALAYISVFLTSTEQGNLDAAVDTYQTALSRNV